MQLNSDNKSLCNNVNIKHNQFVLMYHPNESSNDF